MPVISWEEKNNMIDPGLGERGPGGRDPDQAILDQKRQEIDNAANTGNAQTFAQKIAEISAQVEEINRELEARVVTAEQTNDASRLHDAFPGRIRDQDSLIHKAKIAELYVKEALDKFRQNPGLIPVAVNSEGGRIINRLIQDRSIYAGINEYSAPYIYKIIQNAINNPNQPAIDYLQQFLQPDMRALLQYNRALAERIIIALGEVGGIPADRLQEIIRQLNQPERRGRENGTPLDRILNDPTSAALYETLGIKDKEFFLSLQSAETFRTYCLGLRDGPQGIRQRIENDQRHPNYSRYHGANAEEREKIIAWELSMDLKDRVSSTMYKIYESLLTAPRDKPLETLEQEHGTFYRNVRYFVNQVDQVFSILKTKISESPNGLEGLRFILPKREYLEMYDFENNRSLGTIERILPNLDDYSNDSGELIEFLRLNFDSEIKRLRYGFNHELIIRAGHVDPKKGIMGQIAEYAEELKSSMIDEIFVDRNGEVVQEALALFDFQNENLYAKNMWENDPTNGSEYFSHLSKMSKFVEDYVRERYHGNEPWIVDRAVFNAKLVLYGVYFKPYHWASYADPFLNPGPTVAGQIGLGAFNAAIPGMRFPFPQAGTDLDGDLVMKGVDWMPINLLLKKYNFRDWKDFKKAWEDSINSYKNHPELGKGESMGMAAFFPHFGTDYRVVKLFIDMGNIPRVNAGGWDRISGWRIFLASKDWIRSYLNQSDAIQYNNERPAILVEGWKRLENIGIDCLENYVKKFVVSEVPKKGGTLSGDKLEAMNTLYGYLFDRYFTTDLGKVFLAKAGLLDAGGNPNRAGFIEKISGILTNAKYKEWTKREKDAELNGWIYKALTVIMYERMPLKFMLLEKPRKTQNGVTLRSQLQKHFIAQAGENATEAQKKEALKKFDDAVDDLIFAQARLRTRVSRDMDEVRERVKRDTGDDRNLFGNLQDPRSEVNGGRGYVLNEEVIREILGEVLHDNVNRGERINNVIELYRKLTEQVKLEPPEAAWEHKLEEKWRTEQDPTKKKSLDELRRTHRAGTEVTRLEWFWDFYARDEFGFSPTSGELALKFLSVSSSGHDTIKRCAVYNHDVADNIVALWGEQLKILKEEIVPKKNWKALYDKLLPIYSAVEGQSGSGEPPQEVVMNFLKRGLYYFRDDSGETINPLLGPWRFAKRESSSFHEEENGGPGKASVYKVDANETVKIIQQFSGDLGKAIVAEKPVEENWKMVNGRRIRDYANEISNPGLKWTFKTNHREFIKNFAAGKIAALLIALMMLLIWKAKDDLSVGSKK